MGQLVELTPIIEDEQVTMLRNEVCFSYRPNIFDYIASNLVSK